LNIQEAYLELKKGNFYVKTMRGFFNNKFLGKKKNLTYFLIQLDQELLNNIADEMNLQIFNTEKQFLDNFLVVEAE
jgi:hypothetical protein